MAALRDFGFGGIGLAPDDFSKPDQIVQLGYEPFRIDLITSISGVTFEEAWNDRKVVTSDGLQICFLGMDAYKKNKRASGRPKDLADLDALPSED